MERKINDKERSLKWQKDPAD